MDVKIQNILLELQVDALMHDCADIDDVLGTSSGLQAEQQKSEQSEQQTKPSPLPLVPYGMDAATLPSSFFQEPKDVPSPPPVPLRLQQADAGFTALIESDCTVESLTWGSPGLESALWSMDDLGVDAQSPLHDVLEPMTADQE
eukprot:Clim_evm57s253 gene=Clim_evmTU57s253